MKFTDEGWLLSVNKFQEHSAIVDIFSKEHGLVRGFFRYTRSKSGHTPPIHVHFHYHSRLAEHLGSLKIELLSSALPFAAFDRLRLDLINISIFLIKNIIQEFDERQVLYYAFDAILSSISLSDKEILKLYALFELTLLQTSGFGLNTAQCILTNSTSNLDFISPRTGNIVNFDAAGIYKDKLFKVPAFWHDHSIYATEQDIIDSLTITEYFLSRRVLILKGIEFPKIRMMLIERLNYSLREAS